MSEWRDGFPGLMQQVAAELPPDVPRSVALAKACDLFILELRHYQGHVKEALTPDERRVYQSLVISGDGKCGVDGCGVKDDEGAHRRRGMGRDRK